MVNINIEIPEDLHRQLKIASVLKASTLKEYVIETLEKNAPEVKVNR
jgi:predicted HicB family RNase H-like nuclease